MIEAARDLDFMVRPSGRYRQLQMGERRCLIALVDLVGQEEYYVRLERAVGRPGSVPRMPAHITLFTEPGGGGIGLYSVEQLEALSNTVDLRLENSPWRLNEDGAILGS